jgi:uncharacterized glyoxalase superfamily protein PhnB
VSDRIWKSLECDGQPFHNPIREGLPTIRELSHCSTLSHDEANNPMTFPAAVPEIPSADVGKSAAYYVKTLGFTLDWRDDQGGIAGISRGNCRLFLTNRSFRESYGIIGPVLFWLNLDSKAEVDELFAQWKAAQAKILSEPEDKPWKLREFVAADLDGNLIRVFYDFRTDV